MVYVDGFIVPVPKKKIADYRNLARKAGRIWKEYGALEFKECVADDVKVGKWTSFPRSVKRKPNETVVFSYIVYKSKRDRDRIIHSTAFRRLEYKTQVFINHEGDLFRTRLTHSIEVAQIARSVARRLRLDEDLTEAIALAHDLGHTPFGHAGQDALNACMRPHGGFEHNLQSLRVVDVLEQPVIGPARRPTRTRLANRCAIFISLSLTYPSN